MDVGTWPGPAVSFAYPGIRFIQSTSLTRIELTVVSAKLATPARIMQRHGPISSLVGRIHINLQSSSHFHRRVWPNKRVSAQTQDLSFLQQLPGSVRDVSLPEFFTYVAWNESRGSPVVIESPHRPDLPRQKVLTE